MAEAPDWYAPETTLWLPPHGTPLSVRQALFDKKIAEGTPDFAREVRARLPGELLASDRNPGPYTEEVLLELAAMADKEDELLREYGIESVVKGWHTPVHEGRTRLVARVSVIEGLGLALCGMAVHQEVFDHVRAYQNDSRPGFRLADLVVGHGELNEDNFMIGHRRGTPGTSVKTRRFAMRRGPQLPTSGETFRVDIEPVF